MADSLKIQLARIAASKYKLSNGKTISQNLKDAVNYLYDCVDKFIQEYYRSYTPKVYKRTFEFRDSLYAENIMHARVNGNRLELSVSFEPTHANHTNLFNDHKSYVPLLINSGWNAPKLEQMMGGSVYRLTYYEGYHYIEKAIDYFNRTNTYDIYISPNDVVAEWEGHDVIFRGFNW